MVAVVVEVLLSVEDLQHALAEGLQPSLPRTQQAGTIVILKD